MTGQCLTGETVTPHVIIAPAHMHDVIARAVLPLVNDGRGVLLLPSDLVNERADLAALAHLVNEDRIHHG